MGLNIVYLHWLSDLVIREELLCEIVQLNNSIDISLNSVELLLKSFLCHYLYFLENNYLL